jgi:deferrochelatase/peroxidase EfeB
MAQNGIDNSNLWDPIYRDGQVDAMILIAQGNDANDPGPADQHEIVFRHIVWRKRTGFVRGARVIGSQKGTALAPYGQSLEHFGYPDGGSQPVLLQEDEAYAPADPANPRWNDPYEPADIVLDGNRWSYLVYRKLEQDVRRFAERLLNSATQAADAAVAGMPQATDEQRRARRAAYEEAYERRLGNRGAEILGRFEDGTPIALSDQPRGLRSGLNSFDYRAGGALDPNGESHMRVMNARTAGVAGWQRDQVFPRRGIPYDDRPREDRERYPTPGEGAMGYAPDELPERGVGILFMAYNNDIARQFETVQGRIGRDALLRPGSGYVRMRGGEYFLVPTISWMRNLA